MNELTMINGMVKVFNATMGKVGPQNPVSDFVATQIPLFFPQDLGEVRDLITKMLVNTSNQNPEKVNQAIVDFLNAYRVWYKQQEIKS